jgi:hypothetical protein
MNDFHQRRPVLAPGVLSFDVTRRAEHGQIRQGVGLSLRGEALGGYLVVDVQPHITRLAAFAPMTGTVQSGLPNAAPLVAVKAGVSTLPHVGLLATLVRAAETVEALGRAESDTTVVLQSAPVLPIGDRSGFAAPFAGYLHGRDVTAGACLFWNRAGIRTEAAAAVASWLKWCSAMLARLFQRQRAPGGIVSRGHARTRTVLTNSNDTWMATLYAAATLAGVSRWAVVFLGKPTAVCGGLFAVGNFDSDFGLAVTTTRTKDTVRSEARPKFEDRTARLTSYIYQRAVLRTHPIQL